jgi:hypothetical protein
MGMLSGMFCLLSALRVCVASVASDVAWVHVLHVLSLVRALHLLHLFLCSVLWALLGVWCTLHVVRVACCMFATHYNVQMEVEDHRMADLKAFLPQCIKSRLDAQQVYSS